MMAPDWTDDEVRILRDMFAADARRWDIAAAVGKSYRAVGGKLFRLGLAKPRRAGQMTYPERTAAARAAMRARRQADAESRRAAMAMVEIVDLPLEQSATAVSFQQLKARHCRWPLGDPRDLTAMRFCGGTKELGSSYCSHHRLMASGRAMICDEVA